MKKLILTLLTGMLAVTPAYAAGNVGEYVNFGDYDGYDVRYYIAAQEDVNGDGTQDYLLASSDIIMYKAADTSTNKWNDTAIREWLNSSEKEFSWKVTTAPDSYKNESGFMSDENMSSFERSLVLPVQHKSMWPWDGDRDGGTEAWKWNDGGGTSIKNALTNYDSANYKLSTDKVFLPSLKELVDYNIPLNVSAAESAGAESSNGAFLLRDATAKQTKYMRKYYKWNYVGTHDVTAATGIRTMLYLSGNATLLGDGSKESPYYVKGGRDDKDVAFVPYGGSVGEYINFGDYNGYDVRYYIAKREDVNWDGVDDYLLASSDIIMYKSADKSTNKWNETAIREWLNSSEKEISWKATTAPDSYKNESGFMSDENMSSFERSLVLPVEHKSMYPWDGGKDGGTEKWIWNDCGGTDYKLALTNYDNARYKLSTDKVFLPSVKELVELNIPMNVSAAASAGAESSNGAFLIRDAASETTNKMRYYYKWNRISQTDVTTNIGIRTMLYIDGNVMLCGNGSKESPYYVAGGRDGDDISIKSYTKNADKYSLTVKNKSQADAVAYLMAGVYEEDGTLLTEFYSEKVTVTPNRSKTVAVTIPNSDTKNVKLFYWDTKNKPLELHKSNLTENGKFVFNTDMFCENPENMSNYVIENAFDQNESTYFGVSEVISSRITLSFKYPATVTGLSLTLADIEEWAKVKTLEIYAYNDEQLYRNKIKNPVYVTTVTLKDDSAAQTFDLSGYDKLTGITHLVLKPTAIHTLSYWDQLLGKEIKPWGGFAEITVSGSYDKGDILVERIVNAQIIPNSQIIEGLGINIPDEPSADDIIYALRSIGIRTSTTGEASMSAETLYNIIAERAGYTYQEFLELGIASMIGIEKLTRDDVEVGICEALMTPVKSENKLLLELLYEEGDIPEASYVHIMDKLDIYKNAHMEEYQLASGMSDSASFEFSRSQAPKEISATNFVYNMPFHYEGGYLGTLPKSEAASKQTEFAAALDKAGCAALRFPGGTCAHQYFVEGEEYAKKLNLDVRKWGGLYDVNRKASSYFIEFYDWLDFCTNNGIEPIFQVNTSFYVEPSNDKIYAITKNRYVAEASGSVNSDYYDRDRIDEAAAALGAQIDKLLASGRSIKYWEIGNEEFSTLNYLGTALSDAGNPAEENYAKISAAFIDVIKAKIPDAYIIVTGGFPTLEARYKTLGVYDLIDSVSSHYPFSNWTQPLAIDKDNLTELVTTNEVEFVESAVNYAGTIPQCTTETMTYRLQSWDSSGIQQTFAMALNTAHQWGEAVFETPWEISTLHDLESTYFGFVLYNKKFNPQTRYFVETDTELKTEDMPKDYSFKDEYLLNPSAKAIKLMSEHIGGKALVPKNRSEYRAISAFASEKDGKLMLTVVNKMNSEKTVDITLSGISLPAQTASATCIYSDTLAAMLPREYTTGNAQITAEGSSVSFTARPYSIYQFILCE